MPFASGAKPVRGGLSIRFMPCAIALAVEKGRWDLAKTYGAPEVWSAAPAVMFVRRGAISSSRLNTPRPGYLSRDEGIIQIRFYTGADSFSVQLGAGSGERITESHILLQKVRVEDLAPEADHRERNSILSRYYIDERTDYYKSGNSQDQSLAGFVLKTSQRV